MKQHWWKALGVVIVLYTLLAGLLVPLKPGILDSEPLTANAGSEVVLRVTGYNTHFKAAESSLRAWLKLDESHTLAANRIRALSDKALEIEFQLPAFLPSSDKSQSFTLILDNALDGPSVLPQALFVSQDSLNPALGERLWPQSPIEDLHVKHSFAYPYRNILVETIRNVYYHVPMWFSMFLLYTAALWYTVRFLRTKDPAADRKAVALNTIGLLYGFLGLFTGALWAKHTWGAYWSFDIKQNMTAISLLIYLAYFVLRGSREDPESRGRVAGVYNIFAFSTLIPLLFIIPRLTDSLHPGAGGNPALGGEDLDNTMRLVFYPAIIGWTLLGLWMAQLHFRWLTLRERWLMQAFSSNPKP